MRNPLVTSTDPDEDPAPDPSLFSKVTEDFGTDPHPEPDPLVRGSDPRIRIRICTKMSQIWNTG